MSELMAHMAMKGQMFDEYMSMTPEQYAVASKRVVDEAERRSAFKKYELVRLCLSPGISLVGGMHSLPHDHDDPARHLDSRILGWNMFGDTMVACGYGDNPHLGEMTINEKSIHPRVADDWFTRSAYTPGQHVTYEYDLTGFGPDAGPLGRITQARLIAPHLKDGDWYVSYEKADGCWITRILNESQVRQSD
jgi:hypothetical protein